MKLIIFWLALCAPLLAAAESAQDAPQRQTEVWLELQRDGRQASTHLQAATPAEREISNYRWLDSYKYRIPASYNYESSSGGGDSSDGSSSAN